MIPLKTAIFSNLDMKVFWLELCTLLAAFILNMFLSENLLWIWNMTVVTVLFKGDEAARGTNRLRAFAPFVI